MRIVWVGFHEEGLLAFQALTRSKWKPIAALTLNEKRRSRRSGALDYQQLCADADVPLHEVGLINSNRAKALLRDLNPDLLLVIGWSQILDEDVLGIPVIGTVGAHASLLPHNRGSAPVNWAIIRGEVTGGNTLMWLNPGVDTGQIIAQKEFPIELCDTCESVYHKVAASNKDMITYLLTELDADRKPGVPQAESSEEVLQRRNAGDGLIDWSLSALDIYNLIRAVTKPYPGAFTFLFGKKVMIWKASLLDEAVETEKPAGSVLGRSWSPVVEACGWIVQCGSGKLVLLEVEDEKGVNYGRDLLQMNWIGVRFDS